MNGEPPAAPGEERRGRQHEYASWLPIPPRTLAAVEHPCIIKNVDKGIASLGGANRLSKGLRSLTRTTATAEGGADEGVQNFISASLRPDDPFAKRLLSTPTTTNNLLLKITVPARTGRKRKRGSSGPFLTEEEIEQCDQGSSKAKTPAASSPYVDASTVYRSIRDNASSIQVAFAGVIKEAHRFRTLPDLQYAASQDPIMRSIRDHILPGQFSEMKKFKIDTDSGAKLSSNICPLPEFFQMPVAYNYKFKQNAYVKYTGGREVNLQKSVAYNSYIIIPPTAKNVPTGPKDTLPAFTTLTPYMQALVGEIKAELEKRPIITRHRLYNKLGWNKRTRLRQAAVYCGYFFESGPWREALIQWGVDPRTDPKYRFYQTISFLSYLKAGTSKHNKAFDVHIKNLSRMPIEELETQHTFDGVNVSRTGNLFQFCDITDPLIAKILATSDIRTTCAPTFQGWYHVGTWAKATVIMKNKMNTIIGGEVPDDALYQRVASWPELWDDQEIAATYRNEIMDQDLHREKKKEHDLMHNVRWAARNPRYTFEKMEVATEQGPQPANDGVAEEDIIPEDLTENVDTAAAIMNEAEEVDEESEDSDDTGEEEYDDQEDDDDESDVDSDSEDDVAVSVRAVSEGPAPFGGLYNV